MPMIVKKFTEQQAEQEQQKYVMNIKEYFESSLGAEFCGIIADAFND